MRITFNNWPVYFIVIMFPLLIGYVVIDEIQIHYFQEYNGVVVEKQQIPPKKMPELLIRGNSKTFLVWKWEGINFDEVQLGDSIVKRKHESNAYWYRKLGNGKFKEVKLDYWF